MKTLCLVSIAVMLAAAAGCSCAEGGRQARDGGADAALIDASPGTDAASPRDSGVDSGARSIDAAEAGSFRLICDECAADAECGPVARCAELVTGQRACVPVCVPDIPSCPRRFTCTGVVVSGENVCLPVGGPCCVDMDADAYGQGIGCMGPDCDDDDPERNPGIEDVCDGAENDCDALTDESPTNCAAATCREDGTGGYESIGAQACIEGMCMDDAEASCGLYTCSERGAVGDSCATRCAPEGSDDDRYCRVGAHCVADVCIPDLGPGDPCADTSECARGLSCVDGVCCTSACTGACLRCDVAGSAGTCAPEPPTGAAEACNDLDEDCDVRVDEGCDDDGDDYCDVGIGIVGRPAVCPLGGFDCNDSTAAISPAAAEVCNGIDDNCVMGPDEGRTCVRCGDGIIDLAFGEVCDDAGASGGDDTCSDDCSRVLCSGLGTVEFVDTTTGQCYWRSTEVVTDFSTAQSRCASRGGHLVYLETPAERDLIYTNATGFSSTSRVYIGLSRGGDGVWRWSNGVPLSYTFFRGGEPSGDGTCVEWGPANSGNDLSCGTDRDFVCERDRRGTPR